jgi:hypothetical protein
MEGRVRSGKQSNADTYSLNFNRFIGDNLARRASLVLYFTFISCIAFGFSIFKNLSVNDVFQLFQKREYEFKTVGVARILVGVQSLIAFICLTLSLIAVIS